MNIRVPMKLIRAGLKWAALVPKHAQGDINKALQEKGIDLDELIVDVDGHDKVRIFCE